MADELNLVILQVEVLLLTIIFPVVIVALAGWGVSRLASRIAARQQRHEYPTEQFLAMTYQEQPEQWPPAPTIEPPVAEDITNADDSPEEYAHRQV